MRKNSIAALMALVCCAPVAAQAQQFTNFHVFGDSLSDAGTYIVDINGTPTSARFTVNPYPVWDMLVGSHFGITVSPYMNVDTLNSTTTVLGGNNYAQGGACVNSGFSATLCPVYQYNTLGETQQIATYLAATGGRADPNALYSTWAGANNVFGAVELMIGGSITRAEAIASVGLAAQDQVANVRTLSQAGARFIIVPNLPNIAITPITNVVGEVGFFRDSVNLYNSNLAAGLAGLGGSNIIFVDIYSVLNEVYSDPRRYGIVNVKDPACQQFFSITCTTATLNAPNSQWDYLFADVVHPTPQGHELLSDYIISILEAPGLIGILADVPISAGWGIFRTLDGRLDAPQKAGWQLYSNVDYSTFGIDAGGWRSGVDGSAVGGYVGLEYGFGNGWSAGALLNLSSGGYDFSQNLGNFTSDIFTATLYANLHTGGFYAQASATLGTIDYGSVTREFMMGPALRANSGSTNGTYYSARLATGYDFAIGAFAAGPIAQLSWQQVNVDGYAETQGDASSMRFGSQENSLLFGTAGGRVSYAFAWGEAHLKALAQATYNYDFLGNDRSVNAALVNAPVSFDMPVYAPVTNWTDLRVGLTAEAGANAFASLMAGAQLQGDTGTSWYGNLGLTYRF